MRACSNKKTITWHTPNERKKEPNLIDTNKLKINKNFHRIRNGVVFFVLVRDTETVTWPRQNWKDFIFLFEMFKTSDWHTSDQKMLVVYIYK